MQVRNAIDALLATWESDKLPLALKLLLYLAVLLLLLSLAGFPVVEYTENAHRALLKHAPRLYGMFCGFWIGATIASLAKPAINTTVKTLVLLFTGGREEGGKILVKTEKLADYRWALRVSAFFMLCLLVAVVVLFVTRLFPQLLPR